MRSKDLKQKIIKFFKIDNNYKKEFKKLKVNKQFLILHTQETLLSKQLIIKI